jgi:hypothetical protein
MKHNIIRRVLAKTGIHQKLATRSRSQIGKGKCPPSLDKFDFSSSLKDPNSFYNSCVAYFDQKTPEDIKRHREYFKANKRGFGEDAFHVMWSVLVDRYKPTQFLEIGVYRGQVLSLVSLLQHKYGIEPQVTGIGPFERIGDAASVGDYGHCPDWMEDIRTNVEHFNLPQPRLVKALSIDPEAIEAIQETAWDMIYIDGNHDYEVVVEDWRNCAGNVRVGGCIILDDSGLDTLYRPPLFASGGFPGPSKVANSVDKAEFQKILQVGHNRAFERVR